MPLAINAAPQLALEIFLNRYPDFENDVHDLTNLNAYPMDIFLPQGKRAFIYASQLKRICLIGNSSDEALIWQVRQTYRIINAAISSDEPSMAPLKNELIGCRIMLEQSEPLKSTLAQIHKSKNKEDLNFAGHGCWVNDEGYLNFKHNPNSSIVFYTAFGARLANDLAEEIENKRYDDRKVLIEDTIKHETYSPVYSFKQIYSYQTDVNIPNFSLVPKENFKVRLWGTTTGWMYQEWDETNSGGIPLNKILDLYPDRRIHYIACASLYDAKTDQKFGTYKNMGWRLRYEEDVCSDFYKKPMSEVISLFGRPQNNTSYTAQQTASNNNNLAYSRNNSGR